MGGYPLANGPDSREMSAAVPFKHLLNPKDDTRGQKHAGGGRPNDNRVESDNRFQNPNRYEMARPARRGRRWRGHDHRDRGGGRTARARLSRAPRTRSIAGGDIPTSTARRDGRRTSASAAN